MSYKENTGSQITPSKQNSMLTTYHQHRPKSAARNALLNSDQQIIESDLYFLLLQSEFNKYYLELYIV